MAIRSDVYKDILKELDSKAKLLIVSKTRSIEDILKFYDLGHRDFGENRVEELIDKVTQLPKDIHWHFIGNIQSKKIRKLLKVENLYAIHSISSLKIIQEINKHPQKIRLFLQVNTSLEDQKSGFENVSEITAALETVDPDYIIQGLMTMATMRTEQKEAEAESCFQQLRKYRDSLNPELLLSMGMSSDYKIALNCGSDWVRIGSVLFF